MSEKATDREEEDRAYRIELEPRISLCLREKDLQDSRDTLCAHGKTVIKKKEAFQPENKEETALEQSLQ